MRDKLIEILRKPIFPHELADPIEAVADYLLDNGIIVLPCKAGDTVWFNTYKRGESVGIQPHKVEGFSISAKIERGFGEAYTELPDYEFGKTVFLSRDAAEAKLKEERK